MIVFGPRSVSTEVPTLARLTLEVDETVENVRSGVVGVKIVLAPLLRPAPDEAADVTAVAVTAVVEVVEVVVADVSEVPAAAQKLVKSTGADKGQQNSQLVTQGPTRRQ